MLRKNEIREAVNRLAMAMQDFEDNYIDHELIDPVTQEFILQGRPLFQSEAYRDLEAIGLDTLIPYTKPTLITRRNETDAAMPMSLRNDVYKELDSLRMRNVLLEEYNESVLEQKTKLDIHAYTTEEYNIAVMSEFTRRVRNLYPGNQDLADRLIETIFANHHRILTAMIEDHRLSL